MACFQLYSIQAHVLLPALVTAVLGTASVKSSPSSSLISATVIVLAISLETAAMMLLRRVTKVGHHRHDTLSMAFLLVIPCCIILLNLSYIAKCLTLNGGFLMPHPCMQHYYLFHSALNLKSYSYVNNH